MPWPIVPAPSTAIVCTRAGILEVFSSELVLKVLPTNVAEWRNGVLIQATGLAGACLVRLTRTVLVILYAQPKTPILYSDFGTFPKLNRRRPTPLGQRRTSPSGRDHRLRTSRPDRRNLHRACQSRSPAGRCTGRH